jgi:hypothetical protein
VFSDEHASMFEVEMETVSIPRTGLSVFGPPLATT